MEKKNVHNVKI